MTITTSSHSCRFCSQPLTQTVVDLGMSPLSNSYLKPEQRHCKENTYPLRVYVCASCFLVQLDAFESPDTIFSDYAYFSSFSDSWLHHAQHYAQTMRQRLTLNTESQVVEIASNDGYLLQYFAQAGIPVLGIEPAANVAKVAQEKGIPTEVLFFGEATAKTLLSRGKKADLLIGNNVLAHVPDLNDFVAGLKVLLADTGTITLEFPHVVRLIDENQFDTIYHEHFSYFSFTTVSAIFAHHGLSVVDVDELSTHGGSLRIYAVHSDPSAQRSVAANDLLKREAQLGIETLDYYRSFQHHVHHIKYDLLSFLIDAKRHGKTVVGYGAPAKGNTLLNYCGIGTEFLSYTVDRSPYKQGLYLPGTHIPIESPDKIVETKPDYVLILPWNLKDEIMTQMAHIYDWGGQFVVPIPHLQVLTHEMHRDPVAGGMAHRV